MIWIITVVVIFAAALFLLAKRSEKGKLAQKALPYQKSEALFTPAERSFLGVLHQAVGNNAAIFGKVRVADVVDRNPVSAEARTESLQQDLCQALRLFAV